MPSELPSSAELLRDIARLRGAITPLHRELETANELLQLAYLKESGLIGRHAISERLPTGIIIAAVKFYTWSAGKPQIVYGYRPGTEIWSGIPVTSKGFQIHDAHRASHAA